MDIGEVFGELVYQVWHSEIEPNTILNEMQIRFNYDIAPEQTLEELLAKRSKLRDATKNELVVTAWVEILELDDQIINILTNDTVPH